MSTLLKSAVSKITNLDSSFYRTSKGLLVRPESVTVGYINGVRKVINSPMQYAIITVSLYGLFQFLFSDFLDLVSQNNFLSAFREGWNYEVSTEGIQNVDEMTRAINYLQSRNQFFVFAMIPCIGLLSSAFYRKRGYNIAEHVIISIYAVSFTLLLSVLVGLLLAPFGSESVAEFYVDSFYIINTIAIVWIYKRSLKGSLLKPIAILFLSFIFTFISLLIILLPIVLLM